MKPHVILGGLGLCCLALAFVLSEFWRFMYEPPRGVPQPLNPRLEALPDGTVRPRSFVEVSGLDGHFVIHYKAFAYTCSDNGVDTITCAPTPPKPAP